MTNQDLQNKVYWIDENTNEIESGTYAEFLLQFIDETTTPKGVSSREFVESIDVDRILSDEDDAEFIWDVATYVTRKEIEKEYADDDSRMYYDSNNTNPVLWTVSTWGCCGNNYQQGQTYYSTEESADLAFFEMLENRWNDKYAVAYYETEEEAQDVLDEWNAEEMGVSIETYRHIARKMECLEELRKQKEIERRQKEIERRQKELAEKKAKFRATAGNSIDEILKNFFANEFHPAPIEVLKAKNELNVSWNELRKLYK